MKFTALVGALAACTPLAGAVALPDPTVAELVERGPPNNAYFQNINISSRILGWQLAATEFSQAQEIQDCKTFGNALKNPYSQYRYDNTVLQSIICSTTSAPPNTTMAQQRLPLLYTAQFLLRMNNTFKNGKIPPVFCQTVKASTFASVALDGNAIMKALCPQSTSASPTKSSKGKPAVAKAAASTSASPSPSPSPVTVNSEVLSDLSTQFGTLLAAGAADLSGTCYNLDSISTNIVQIGLDPDVVSSTVCNYLGTSDGQTLMLTIVNLNSRIFGTQLKVLGMKNQTYATKMAAALDNGAMNKYGIVSAQTVRQYFCGTQYCT